MSARPEVWDLEARYLAQRMRTCKASFPKLTERYSEEMARPELGHLSWVVLHTPAETDRFLTGLRAT